MRIDIVTLFPGMLEAAARESILGRARARGLVDIRVHNLRDYATGRHRVTDEHALRRRRRHDPEARAARARCVEALRAAPAARA